MTRTFSMASPTAVEEVAQQPEAGAAGSSRGGTARRRRCSRCDRRRRTRRSTASSRARRRRRAQAQRVAVHEVEVAPGGDAVRTAATRARGATSFQPTCGMRASSPWSAQARDLAVDPAEPGVSPPSCRVVASSCIPRQMPRNGTRAPTHFVARGHRRGRERGGCAIASGNAPTPGRTMRPALRELGRVAGDERGAPPHSSTARPTESRLHMP